MTTPAAPVGDDAELVRWLRDQPTGQSEEAADRLESLRAENSAQAARIAELERQLAARREEAMTTPTDDLVRRLLIDCTDLSAYECNDWRKEAAARIAELERANAALSIIVADRDQGRTLEMVKRQLAAAERCIRAADELRHGQYHGNGHRVRAYDTARAGITLSAESGGEGGV